MDPKSQRLDHPQPFLDQALLWQLALSPARMAPKVQTTSRLLLTETTTTVVTVTTNDDNDELYTGRYTRRAIITTTPSKRRRLDDDARYSDAVHYEDDNDN